MKATRDAPDEAGDGLQALRQVADLVEKVVKLPITSSPCGASFAAEARPKEGILAVSGRLHSEGPAPLVVVKLELARVPGTRSDALRKVVDYLSDDSGRRRIVREDRPPAETVYSVELRFEGRPLSLSREAMAVKELERAQRLAAELQALLPCPSSDTDLQHDATFKEFAGTLEPVYALRGAPAELGPLLDWAQETMALAVRAVTKHLGIPVDDTFKPLAKIQLSPCYTSYPAIMAAIAAIGHTAFLELQARATANVILVRHKEYFDQPAKVDFVACDPAIYKQVSLLVVQAVQSRLFLEELATVPGLGCVDAFRMFLASQQDMRFPCLAPIIDAIILYGDLLPPWEHARLHAMTRCILEDVTEASRFYFQMLERNKGRESADLGYGWVRAVCKALADYLPFPQSEKPAESPSQLPPSLLRRLRMAEIKQRLSRPDDAVDWSEIAPLDSPVPPALSAPPKTADRIRRALADQAGGCDKQTGSAPLPEPIQKALTAFAQAIDGATGQAGQWEDMRSDLVEEAVKTSGTVRASLDGPLIQWIYHPRKTSAMGRRDAIRAVAGLPDCGTGCQSDALSLGHILLNEAPGLARGAVAYLILISDCCWNRSFATSKDGQSEMLALFAHLYEEYGRDRLHTTLVALGVGKETGFEKVVDKLIAVSPANLKDPTAVAAQIGTYVAATMRERRRIVRE